MKRTFCLTDPKIKPARLLEAARRDIRRYVKRERNRALPDGADFWDFDCKFGHTEQSAEAVQLSELKTCLDEAEKLQLKSFYVEVFAKEGVRPTK